MADSFNRGCRHRRIVFDLERKQRVRTSTLLTRQFFRLAYSARKAALCARITTTNALE